MACINNSSIVYISIIVCGCLEGRIIVYNKMNSGDASFKDVIFLVASSSDSVSPLYISSSNLDQQKLCYSFSSSQDLNLELLFKKEVESGNSYNFNRHDVEVDVIFRHLADHQAIHSSTQVP